jgi:starch phosphorylase
MEKKKVNWENFPSRIMMQLNDTHPVLAIVELLRIFIDVEKIEEKEAWAMVTSVFGYTNHTVLP